MTTDVEVRTERRKVTDLRPDDRFQWHNKWYVLSERSGRSMAVGLEPNLPYGNPGPSGHAPPMVGEVDVLVIE